MVVRVKLKGLKIVRSRDKWYVYHRQTGDVLLRGFEGDKAALLKELSSPERLVAYTAKRKLREHAYSQNTLGWLISWFETEWPGFGKLSAATRNQYQQGLAYLQPEFDAPLDTITQAALYDVRDKCAAAKWPRFADKMMTALSSMFTQAVRRGKMPNNPALGMERAHKSDPGSNREWRPEEWTAVLERAPSHFKIPLMLARHAGFRGQTISVLQWRDYQSDQVYGKCFRLVIRKNDELTWIPATPELQAFLDGLNRTSLNVATRKDGTPWRHEKQLQTAMSNWLKRLERDGVTGTGLTLHGLRVTYAAGLRRDGADASDVAAALGDRTPRMGEHYTRHVENEARVIRAFGKPKRDKA